MKNKRFKTPKLDISALTNLRKEASLTQAELAKKIGVSRETVVAIEKEYESTIRSLSFDVVAAWIEICKATANKSTLLELKTAIYKKLGM